jgi:hypothetical protein
MMKNINNKILPLLIIISLLYSCAEKEKKEDIVVTINDKIITAGELKRRAEYTIRPEIFADKRVVLNNLIAEKLLAMEAEKNKNFFEPQHLQDFLKGIREQSIRERLYYTEIYNPIIIDSLEVDQIFPLSNRSYELEFYNIGSKAMADSLNSLLSENPDQANRIFDQIAAFDSVPKHIINWQDTDSYIIHDALFSKPLSENQVIGPLTLEDNSNLIFKVTGWKETPVIGPEEIALRRQKVRKKIKEKKAEKKWRNYMQEVMRNKNIEFDPAIFNKLADLSYRVYSQGALKDKLPIEDQSIQKEAIRLAIGELIDDPSYHDLTFLTIDDNIWSIEKFKNELASHPLVFRQNRIFTFEEYREQFRAAIADLVRDHYLTQVAYGKSLDKTLEVKQTVSMWRDASLAQSQWYIYAKALQTRPDFDPKDMKGNNNYLGQYVDSLMIVYEDKISLDWNVFKEIRLTRIPMYVYKPGMPYPAAVPVFPQLTLKRSVTY